MLKLVDIRKSYRIGPSAIQVLRGIDLQVSVGDFLAIIGPSGSGKSTLMNIIGLLEQPSAGTYFFDNTQVTYDDDRKLSSLRNRRIGFVFQQYHLLPRLSALENAALPIIYRGAGKREVHELAMEYLKKVNMHERAMHKPTELSGGQQQRVSIARALIGRPSIILADEPTGALDSATGAEILHLFQELNEKEGITVIIITHDLKIAEQCRRKVLLKDGKIIDH